MTAPLPTHRPRLTFERVWALVPVAHRPLLDGLALVGVRGFFLADGAPGVNDFGIFDDAVILVSPDCLVAFNGNTDPVRQGWNAKVGKPYAQLAAGVWRYTAGLHKGTPAFIQHAPVTVHRDAGAARPDVQPYDETGWFGINIHPAGWQSVNSEGCQTVHRGQWDGFHALLTDELRRWKVTAVPYILTGI